MSFDPEAARVASVTADAAWTLAGERGEDGLAEWDALLAAIAVEIAAGVPFWDLYERHDGL